MTPPTGGRRRLLVEADGGSRGNPGPAGYGAVVRDATGEVLAEVAEGIGRATNNVAEYRGLLAGLTAAAAIDPDAEVEVRMDSKLVVEQMSGRWQVKHPDMRELAVQVRRVLPPERVSYQWIPRASNSHADRLANEAMDAAAAGRPWTRRRGSGLDDPPAGPQAPQAPQRPAEPLPSEAFATSTPDSGRAPRRPDVGEPTTLVLVRHGRTELTEQKRISGRGTQDPGLSAAGRADAAAAAAAVAALGAPSGLLPGSPSPAVVLASPLRRTRETAAAIAAAVGCEVAVEEGFVEASFGDWDGLTYPEIAQKWPEEFAAWQGSVTAEPPGGGESLTSLVRRVRRARGQVCARYPGRLVVVVTHVTPVRAVVHEALDAGDAALWRLRVGPCSLTAVRFWSDGGAEVAAVNVSPHVAAG